MILLNHPDDILNLKQSFSTILSQIETLKPVYEEAKEALSKCKGLEEKIEEDVDSSDF